MTPQWAKKAAYQVLSFILSLAMVVGVAIYAFTKSYEERKLTFVDGFTICAHTGAFDTQDNTVEAVEAAINGGADAVEVDVRQRPDGTIVIGHDIITTNTGGVELETVFKVVAQSKIKMNLDIKDINVLEKLRKLIKDYSFENRVFLTGIEVYQTDQAKKYCPDIEYYINYLPSRIKIFSEDYQEKIIKMVEDAGAVGINCNHTNASKTLSEVLHNNGYKLSVWTVDKEYQMMRALVNEPDNITTHNVTQLREVIKNWGNNK